MTSDGIHHVVLYTRHDTKTFSITARMERARLEFVNNGKMVDGFTEVTLAENLHKDAAEELKNAVNDALKKAGYTYQNVSRGNG